MPQQLQISLPVWRSFYHREGTEGPWSPPLGSVSYDILVVAWVGREGFADFLVELNSFHPNLEYTSKESTTDINFLDLKELDSRKGILDLGPNFKNFAHSTPDTPIGAN